jgi:4-amino-4-deoxy-L-arabinose transferase-like glycosyltransferase
MHAKHTRPPLLQIISIVLITFVVATYAFSFIFFWMNSIVDSYFYYAIGQFFKTGVYPYISPFFFDRPTTLSPPLYGIILASIQSIPYPHIVLHTIQIFMVLTTGYILYLLLIHQTINRYIAISVASLYVLFPINIIFSSYILTETPAQFFFCVYLFCTLHYLKTKRGWYLLCSFLIVGIMMLNKYIFAVYSIPTIFLWIRSGFLKNISGTIGFVCMVFIFSIWISVNYSISGVIGLSDSIGNNLYNAFIWHSNIEPSEQSLGMKTIRLYVPKQVNLHKAYWELQEYILPYVGYSWPRTDAVFKSFVISAIREHPIEYIQNSIHNFIVLHSGNVPYWDNLSTFGTYQKNQPVFCGLLGTIPVCQALLSFPSIYSVWNIFVQNSTFIFRYVMPIYSYLIFLPLLFVGLFLGNQILKSAILLYLIGTIPMSMVVHPDTRYIMPFYALSIYITLLSGKTILSLFHSLYIKRKSK